MSEVKWIKITTDMFEDEKIDFISSLPEADAIIVIWIRLLTLAGRCNAGGYVFLTEKIPYTDEMLAHKFKKPLNIIKLALETFQRLEMIEIDDKGIFLPNWEKHQNIEALEIYRERERLRKREQRQKKKLLQLSGTMSGTCPGQSQESPRLDIDKDKDNNYEDLRRPETILDAHYQAFKKWNLTGTMEGYIKQLLNRGATENFIVEVILEMGERGIGPNVRYMEKLAEDWMKKGIKTREESRAYKESLKSNITPMQPNMQPKNTQSSKPKLPVYKPQAPKVTDEQYEEILRKVREMDRRDKEAASQ